jgi:hypothetical protein
MHDGNAAEAVAHVRTVLRRDDAQEEEHELGHGAEEIKRPKLFELSDSDTDSEESDADVRRAAEATEKVEADKSRQQRGSADALQTRTIAHMQEEEPSTLLVASSVLEEALAAAQQKIREERKARLQAEAEVQESMRRLVNVEKSAQRGFERRAFDADEQQRKHEKQLEEMRAGGKRQTSELERRLSQLGQQGDQGGERCSERNGERSAVDWPGGAPPSPDALQKENQRLRSQALRLNSLVLDAETRKQRWRSKAKTLGAEVEMLQGKMQAREKAQEEGGAGAHEEKKETEGGHSDQQEQHELSADLSHISHAASISVAFGTQGYSGGAHGFKDRQGFDVAKGAAEVPSEILHEFMSQLQDSMATGAEGGEEKGRAMDMDMVGKSGVRVTQDIQDRWEEQQRRQSEQQRQQQQQMQQVLLQREREIEEARRQVALCESAWELERATHAQELLEAREEAADEHRCGSQRHMQLRKEHELAIVAAAERYAREKEEEVMNLARLTMAVQKERAVTKQQRHEIEVLRHQQQREAAAVQVQLETHTSTVELQEQDHEQLRQRVQELEQQLQWHEEYQDQQQQNELKQQQQQQQQQSDESRDECMKKGRAEGGALALAQLKPQLEQLKHELLQLSLSESSWRQQALALREELQQREIKQQRPEEKIQQNQDMNEQRGGAGVDSGGIPSERFAAQWRGEKAALVARAAAEAEKAADQLAAVEAERARVSQMARSMKADFEALRVVEVARMEETSKRVAELEGERARERKEARTKERTHKGQVQMLRVREKRLEQDLLAAMLQNSHQQARAFLERENSSTS